MLHGVSDAAHYFLRSNQTTTLMTTQQQLLLTDLHQDMVRHILGFLAPRPLLMAACTCSLLRHHAAEMPLRPTMTSANQRLMLGWLARAAIARRVLTLTARNCLWGPCSFVSGLSCLETLVITFGRVSTPMFRVLPLTLKHLEVHRVEGDYGGVFSTSRLKRLVHLHTLKLTFTPRWELVVLDGLAQLPLRHVCIRLAPTLLVREALDVHTLHMHAVSRIMCSHALKAHHLLLECAETPLVCEALISQETAPHLRSLRLSCPHRVTVPWLGRMTQLERLDVRFDTVLVPLRQLGSLSALRLVHLETRYGVAVTGTECSLPTHVRVKASVGGVEVSEATVHALFHSGRPRHQPVDRAGDGTVWATY